MIALTQLHLPLRKLHLAVVQLHLSVEKLYWNKFIRIITEYKPLIYATPKYNHAILYCAHITMIFLFSYTD